jgi:outer membrane usher protein
MMGAVLSRLLPLLFPILLLTPASSAAQEQRAFLEVTLNGVAKGDTLVVMRDADALVAVKMLTEAGLQGFEGQRESIGGEPFVSLASLAPLVTFATSEADLALAITADPRLLGSIVQDLQSGAPSGMEHRRAASAFVNYALTASGARDYDIFTESAFSAGPGLVYNTTTMTRRGAVRGLTSLTFDDRTRLRRWVVGDSFAGGSALGGDALLAGLSISREFSLAPYFVRHPTLSLTTPISTPSTVEVHVNGRLVRSEQVQPGRLDLQNLPLTTGANDTRVVVRDPFGGTRELATSYYLTTSVLAPGIQEYQYAVGFRRNGFGNASFDYAAPALIARHRWGLTDWFSAGARVEAQRGLVNSGTILNLRVPFGELEAAAGVSRGTGAPGTAVQLSYSYASRRGSFGGTVRDASAAYAVVGTPTATARARRELTVYAGFPLVHGANLNLQHSEALGDATVRQRRSSLSSSLRVYRRLDLTTALTRGTGPTGPTHEVSVGLNMSFGGRVASSSVVRRDGVTRMALDLQQPLPVNTGVGYQLHTETGERNASSGVLQYQGKYGRYELRNERTQVGGPGHTTASVAGALVGIGGGLYATRPVRNSFALVRVPGVDGVRAYSSHQEVGRTNGKGNLLIPDLLPYYGNELNIADSDIPLEYIVPKVNVTLAPPYRGGAVVMFPVRRIQRTSGRVVVASAAGEDQPSYGELTLTAAGEVVNSPLGASGEFYFENLPEGKHEANVTFEGGSCSFILTIPRSEEPALDLGALKCAVTDKR